MVYVPDAQNVVATSATITDFRLTNADAPLRESLRGTPGAEIPGPVRRRTPVVASRARNSDYRERQAPSEGVSDHGAERHAQRDRNRRSGRDRCQRLSAALAGSTTTTPASAWGVRHVEALPPKREVSRAQSSIQ